MISTKKNPFTFKLVDVGSNPVLELTNATDQTFKCVEILTVFLKDKENPGPSQVHIRFEAVEHILAGSDRRRSQPLCPGYFVAGRGRQDALSADPCRTLSCQD